VKRDCYLGVCCATLLLEYGGHRKRWRSSHGGEFPVARRIGGDPNALRGMKKEEGKEFWRKEERVSVKKKLLLFQETVRPRY